MNIQKQKKEKEFLKPKGIIPSNILYINSTEFSQNEKVVWFTKAQKKDLFFVENLNVPNGKANVPPLLWVGNRRSLKIFALNPTPVQMKIHHFLTHRFSTFIKMGEFVWER